MNPKNIKPKPNGIWILGIIVMLFWLFFGEVKEEGAAGVYNDNKDNPQFMKHLKDSVETKHVKK